MLIQQTHTGARSTARAESGPRSLLAPGPWPSTKPTASSAPVPKDPARCPSLAHFSLSSENCFSRSSISLRHSLRRRS